MKPILETERLLLRPIDADKDFEPWARAMADANTMRYLGSQPLSRALAWRNMAMVMGHWALRGYGFFSLESKATGEWIGRVGPWFPEGWPAPEIGWTISPDHLRQGYAIEAARASLDYVFNTLGWQEVIHVILPGNAASIAVAEKLGSVLMREQHGLPGIIDDTILIYGQENISNSSGRQGTGRTLT